MAKMVGDYVWELQYFILIFQVISEPFWPIVGEISRGGGQVDLLKCSVVGFAYHQKPKGLKTRRDKNFMSFSWKKKQSGYNIQLDGLTV